MKKVKLNLIFAIGFLGLLSSGSAFAQNGVHSLEQRISSYLETYLDPYDFMVVVSPKKDEPKVSSESVDSSLPGLPGMDGKEDSKYRSYFDVNGKVHASPVRPPVSIQVLFSRRVSNEVIKTFKKSIPMIANVDEDYGDEVKVTTGGLDRPRSLAAEEKPVVQPHTIEVMVKYKKDLLVFAVVLGAIAVLLLLIHEIMSYWRAISPAQTSKIPSDLPKNDFKPAGASSQDTPAPFVGGKKALSKDQLYSKDSALYGRIQEIVLQAKSHPERIVRLLTNWIQSGEVGIRNAGIFIHNFDMQTTEQVLAKMLASDVNYLKDQIDTDFDPFSDENNRVIMQARQDLMKIVAEFSKSEKQNDFQFINELEQHMLVEVLKDEPPQVLALFSTVVPAHRLAEILKKQSPEHEREFIESLCEMKAVSSTQITETTDRLKKKIAVCKQMPFTEDEKAQTFINLLKNIKSDKHRNLILNEISEKAPDIQKRVRDNTFLFQDVIHLSDRATKILMQELDPAYVARAFSRESAEAKEKVRLVLPKSSLEIFDYELSQQNIFPDHEYDEACMVLIDQLSILVYSKVINSTEIHRKEHSPSSELKLASGHENN